MPAPTADRDRRATTGPRRAAVMAELGGRHTEVTDNRRERSAEAGGPRATTPGDPGGHLAAHGLARRGRRDDAGDRPGGRLRQRCTGAVLLEQGRTGRG